MAPVKWTSERILCAIHERKMTLDKLAIKHDRNPSSFRHIWKRPNTINEAIVAEFLGVPAEQLWPDRYPKSTSRIFDSKIHGDIEGQKTARADNRVAA